MNVCTNLSEIEIFKWQFNRYDLENYHIYPIKKENSVGLKYRLSSFSFLMFYLQKNLSKIDTLSEVK